VDNEITAEDEANLYAFLKGLTELSRRFQIGITGSPELYLMESPEDDERRYRCDDESRLVHE
jgi:hypothetical protein